MKRELILLAALAPLASAQSTLDSIGLIGYVFGALAIIYAWRTTSAQGGIEERIGKEKALLIRIRQEIVSEKQTLERLRRDIKDVSDDKLKSEMKKADEKPTKKEQAGLRNDYWNRIDEISGGKADPEVKKLTDERAEIQTMIEMTKAKYHTRAIDEKSFSNIIEDYQKRLIEIEAKLKKLSGGDNGS